MTLSFFLFLLILAGPGLLAFALAVAATLVVGKRLGDSSNTVRALFLSSLFIILFYVFNTVLLFILASLMPDIGIISFVAQLTGLGALVFLLGWVLRLVGIGLAIRSAWRVMPGVGTLPAYLLKGTPILVIVALAMLYQPVLGLVFGLPVLWENRQGLMQNISSLQQQEKEQEEALRQREFELDARLAAAQTIIEAYKTQAGTYPGSLKILQDYQGWDNPLLFGMYARVGQDDYQVCDVYPRHQEVKCVTARTSTPVESQFVPGIEATADVDDQPVVYTSISPVITGTASGISGICVWVRPEGLERPKAVAGPQSVPGLLWGGCSPEAVTLSDGRWSAHTVLPREKLTSPNGLYVVVLSDKNSPDVLTAEAVIIRPK